MQSSKPIRRLGSLARPPDVARNVTIDDDQSEMQAGMSMAQAIAVLRAYWKQTLIIWLGVTIVSGVMLTIVPKTYTATATLIVDTTQKDPLAGQEFQVNLLNNYVATQAELMTSPVVLLPVVDRLDLTHDRNLTAGFQGDLAGLRDYVQRNLSYVVQVDQGRGGQLLYLSASARSAVKAADIANAVADSYLAQEQRRINDPAGERAQRYSQQIAELRAKVAGAQEKVAAFRQQKGITDVSTGADPDNPDTETRTLSNLEERLLEAQNQRRALEAKLGRKQPSSDEALASQQVQQLQAEVRNLQSQLAQLGATYGTQHPKFVQVESQIRVAQRALQQEMDRFSTNNVSELGRAKSLEEKYTRAVDDQRSKVLLLRAVQGEGAKLLLELESAQAVYKRALDGYDQIMFASVGHTNVNIISRASPPVRASKPNKLKLLMMGTFAGFGFGLCATFLYELLLNRRVRCRDDMERFFGIPVLMQFNAIPNRANQT
jgi:succinoglycan biosynthesis transport protein ExoP